jgi:flavodoxin
MSVCIVYHSETGNTKKVAEAAAKATGATLIPVRDLAGYNKITMYLLGIPRARAGDKAAIEPPVIDISAFDLVVVGSPVWAFRPTPAANAAIAALSGCEGKKGIVFITSGGGPRDALGVMKKALEGRKVKVEGAFHFPMKEPGDEKRLKEFTEAIKRVSGMG